MRPAVAIAAAPIASTAAGASASAIARGGVVVASSPRSEQRRDRLEPVADARGELGGRDPRGRGELDAGASASSAITRASVAAYATRSTTTWCSSIAFAVARQRAGGLDGAVGEGAGSGSERSR